MWILSLPGTAVASLFVSFCVLPTWRDFLPAWGTQVVSSYLCRKLNPPVGGPQNTAQQKCGLHSVCSSYKAGQEMECTSFAAWVLLTVASSQRNCLGPSFFWTILGSGSGFWEGGILCICGGHKDVGSPSQGSQPQRAPRA